MKRYQKEIVIRQATVRIKGLALILEALIDSNFESDPSNIIQTVREELSDIEKKLYPITAE